MRTTVTGIVALFVLLVAVVIAYSSVFTVDQTEQALVVRLGEPVGVVTDPGLHFKAPFIDTVILIDRRILDLENPSQEVIASDQKRLVVDAFARYRIKDALRFYQSVGSIQAANVQLTTLLNDSLRGVLGEVTFIQVVRDAREALRGRIRDQLDKESGAYGIQGWGAALVERIDGDFFGVMGLPVRLVLQLLAEAGHEYRFHRPSTSA